MEKTALVRRFRAQFDRQLHLLVALLYLSGLIVFVTMISMWSVYQ